MPGAYAARVIGSIVIFESAIGVCDLEEICDQGKQQAVQCDSMSALIVPSCSRQTT